MTKVSCFIDPKLPKILVVSGDAGEGMLCEFPSEMSAQLAKELIEYALAKQEAWNRRQGGPG